MTRTPRDPRIRALVVALFSISSPVLSDTAPAQSTTFTRTASQERVTLDRAATRSAVRRLKVE